MELRLAARDSKDDLRFPCVQLICLKMSGLKCKVDGHTWWHAKGLRSKLHIVGHMKSQVLLAVEDSCRRCQMKETQWFPMVSLLTL